MPKHTQPTVAALLDQLMAAVERHRADVVNQRIDWTVVDDWDRGDAYRTGMKIAIATHLEQIAEKMADRPQRAAEEMGR
jgi:hypothetical protein